ncbi:MAG: porphobilinogen synthase [Thermoprotei archaeon]|jgi:porphobilinogen synthase
MRRLRLSKALRDLVAETYVNPSQLIMPFFVKEGLEGKEQIVAMPGQYRFSVDALVDEVKELLELGIRSILLFGIPLHKDEFATSDYDPQGIVQRTIRQLRKEYTNQVIIIADVCTCEYTTHGHCGIIKRVEQGSHTGELYVDNDETLKVLTKVSLSYAEAGVDIVAPSAMMDGQVKAIREALDDAGYKDVAIMGYSAKHASTLYGPFREAASSAPQFGDRKSYQMDPRNAKEALREIELDIKEGADIIMVKPALWYLDIIKSAKERFNVPIAAYSVSGEYTMIKLAAQNNFINEKAAVWEALTAIKRAGADIIITYFAKDYARWLKNGEIP